MATPAIRHVRYPDFIALSSEGVGDLAGFRSAVDTLLRDMGTLHAHHVLFDLRHATIPPLADAILVEAMEYLRRSGLGVANKVAIAVDRDDSARVDRARECERIAGHMGMRLRGFADPIAALKWLSAGD
jgi:hypothetical protein